MIFHRSENKDRQKNALEDRAEQLGEEEKKSPQRRCKLKTLGADSAAPSRLVMALERF